MNDEADVLERNLQALLARAFAPVAVREGFREELLELCLARLRTSRFQAAPAFRRPAVRVAALAAGILALFAASWFARSLLPSDGLEDLLRRGEVAVRDEPDGPWRALSALPGAPATLPLLLVDQTFVELATPRSRSAVVEAQARDASGVITPSGRVFIDAGSRARLEQSAGDGGLSIDLVAGALAAERGSPPSARPHDGRRWRIAAAGGRLDFAWGSVSVEAKTDPACARIVLRAGEAVAFAASGSEVPLRPARETRLCTGEELGTLATADSSSGGGMQGAPPYGDRTPVDPQSESEPPPPEPAWLLSGTVKGASDGATLDEFVVVLLPRLVLPKVTGPRSVPFTSAGGRFEIGEPVLGPCTVFVQARGFALWRSGELELGVAPVELEVALVRGATVEGRVIEASTRRPLEGATVLSESDAAVSLLPFDLGLLKPPARSVATTDAEGRFELAHLSPGEHVIRASSKGLAAEWHAPISLADAEERAGLELALSPGGAIEGRIEADGGEPWSGAQVVAMPIWRMNHRPMVFDWSQTGPDGKFAHGDLPAGTWVVVNLARAERGGGKTDMRQVQVEVGKTARADFLAEARGTRLRGRVLDGHGAPIADRPFSIMPVGAVEAPGGNGPPARWRSTTTGKDGEYEFVELSAGKWEYYLAANLPMEVIYQGSIEIPEGGDLERDVVVASGEIAGRVTDRESGAGLPASVLVLFRFDESRRDWCFTAKIFSDADGRYVAPLLLPGRYRVNAYATVGSYGFESLEGIWLLEGAHEEQADIALSPGAVVEMRVVDEGGEPVAGAFVRVFEKSGEVEVMEDQKTDARGRIRLTGLRLGWVRVEVEREGYRKEGREWVLGAEEAEETVVLRR